MIEILPDRLWLGNAHDARNPSAVHQRGIRAILDLAHDEPPIVGYRDLIVSRVPLVDASGNDVLLLRIAISQAVSLLKNDVPTLIACSAGLSRTPAIAAAALSIHKNRDPDDVLNELIAQRPHDVSPTLWNDVKNVLPTI
ncbi:MAG: hypothetical protein ACI9G1_003963 [Pirellulaceae bacterium]|jgi:hypothetical protein